MQCRDDLLLHAIAGGAPSPFLMELTSHWLAAATVVGAAQIEPVGAAALAEPVKSLRMHDVKPCDTVGGKSADRDDHV